MCFSEITDLTSKNATRPFKAVKKRDDREKSRRYDFAAYRKLRITGHERRKQKWVILNVSAEKRNRKRANRPAGKRGRHRQHNQGPLSEKSGQRRFKEIQQVTSLQPKKIDSVFA